MNTRCFEHHRPARWHVLLYSALLCVALFGATRASAVAPDEVFCSGFDAITVCPGVPSPFLLIPNRASTFATTAMEIYLSAIPSSPDVALLGPSGQVVPLTVNGQDLNRVEAVIPSGLAAGMWSVRVTSAGQVGTLLDSLRITDTQTTLALSGLNIGAVSNQARTRVTLSATDPPPLASVGFAALPEVFLQPVGGGTALRIRDREFVSAAALEISIPPGYIAGLYHVIAINPDGSTGVLDYALSIVGNLGPRIDHISPQTAFPQALQSITLSGELFGATAPTISAECVDSAGNSLAAVSGNVGSANASVVTAAFDFSTVPANSVCRLQLMASNGLSTSYVNLPIVPIGNYCLGGSSTDAGQSLLQGRRGGVLLAGPSAPEGRRLYMIGGDSGSAAGALDSVESAGVSATGALTSFRNERYALPQPVTFAGGATVGDYLYVTGGNNGSATLATAYRARVLRDLRSPDFIDFRAAVGNPGNGVGAGLWTYRVAPLYPGTDTDNPNGEGLPGAALSVELPVLPNGTQVTLNWDAVSGANAYAIYRSPSAGAATLERLAIVSGTTLYSDSGTATNPTNTPLPIGSLTNWVALPSMSTLRQGVGVASTTDPADPSKHYVYAIAGNSGPTTATLTYEYLPITIAFDGGQTNSSWTPGSSTLGTGRQHLAVWAMSANDTPLLAAGTAYVYAGPGAAGNGTTGVQSVDAGLTAVGGDLGNWNTTPKDATTTSFGAATAQARECMFLFGGLSGAPSTSIYSGMLSLSPPALTVASWNSTGIPMVHGRIYAGAAMANGFIYIAGGQTDAPSAADISVERIVQ